MQRWLCFILILLTSFAMARGMKRVMWQNILLSSAAYKASTQGNTQYYLIRPCHSKGSKPCPKVVTLITSKQCQIKASTLTCPQVLTPAQCKGRKISYCYKHVFLCGSKTYEGRWYRTKTFSGGSKPAGAEFRCYWD